MTRLQAIIFAALSVAAAVCSNAWGQAAYPSKPLTIRVAFPAGGPADIFARQVSPKMQGALGQTVIVDNFSGAGGVIGALNVLKAQADGYTLMMHTVDVVLAPLALASAQYKAEQFRLVATLGTTDLLLVARPSMKARSLAELADYSKNSPNGLTLAHQGAGSMMYLAGEDLKKFAGLTATGIPYKGTAPMIQDLLGDHVDIGFVPFGPNTVAMVQQKKLIAIGVAAPARSPVMPDVPTLSEMNPQRPPFIHSMWLALLVPSATPDAVVQRLNKVATEVVQSPEFRKFTTDAGARPLAMSTKEADEFYAAEVRKYAELARQLNMQPQ